MKIFQPKLFPYSLVVSVPHSGETVPSETLASFVSGDRCLLLSDSDLFVDDLYAEVPDVGGVLLVQEVCRYVVDLNRAATQVDASFLSGAPVLKSPPHLGLVAHKTMRGTPLLKAPLSEADFSDRLINYYYPFHNALAQNIERSCQQFGFCLHIDAHSMPSQGAAGHTDAGKPRPDVCVSDWDGRSCDPRFIACIENAFRRSGLFVQRNDPYHGGFITQHYGQPTQKVHTVQIELNRALYMDEKRLEPLPGQFEQIKRIIGQMVMGIKGFGFD